jgi:hypothetical protein
VWNHLEEHYKQMLAETSAVEDVAMSVFLFGNQEIRVREFGYAGPNLFVVHGFIGKDEVTAYVHQACLQVVFSKVPKDAKAGRLQIGFAAPKEEADEGAAHEKK